MKVYILKDVGNGVFQLQLGTRLIDELPLSTITCSGLGVFPAYEIDLSTTEQRLRFQEVFVPSMYSSHTLPIRRRLTRGYQHLYASPCAICEQEGTIDMFPPHDAHKHLRLVQIFGHGRQRVNNVRHFGDRKVFGGIPAYSVGFHRGNLMLSDHVILWFFPTLVPMVLKDRDRWVTDGFSWPDLPSFLTSRIQCILSFCEE